VMSTGIDRPAATTKADRLKRWMSPAIAKMASTLCPLGELFN
jgi:hypothetical protein